MATSFQRVLVMAIMFNLLLVLVNGFVNSIDESEQLDTFLGNIKSRTNSSNFLADNILESNPDTQQYKLDNVPGNPQLGLVGIGKLLVKGMGKSFLGCINVGDFGHDCTSWEKKWIVSGMTSMFYLINLLFVLELVYLFYSKKNT